MGKAEILTRFSDELEHSSPETRRTREFWAVKFLDFAGNKPFTKWNKSLVYAFEQQLRKEGYAPLTIRSALGIVKRVFDAAKAVHEAERTRLISEADPNNPSAVAEILKAISLPGPQWDVGKRWLIRVEPINITKPALTLDEIEKMVTTARNGGLELPEVCYLALSSIYGLRREELYQVRREHIDFDKKTIFVDTCKGGEKREQLLCDEIVPYLKSYDFSRQYSPFMLSRMFKQICFKSGVEDRDGGGWHQCRRFLATSLRDSLAVAFRDLNIKMDAQLATKIFLRWRLSSSSEMADRYYTKDLLKVDNLALAHHPVVSLWR